MGVSSLLYQRNYLKILFPVTVVLLVFSIIYIWTIDRLPAGPDLCGMLKDKDGHKNITRQWWEWACLIEQEWDKELDYNCNDERKIGNYYICFDEPYKISPPCLVYSFGIDNDFRFDDAMGDIGCDVYSFDPSMNVEDHQRSERVHFLNIGIAAHNSDQFSPIADGYTQGRDKIWRIRTLSSIKKMLGHENRTLSVLKVDVETYEWEIFKHLLTDGSLNFVKQIAMEWHIFSGEPPHSESHNMFLTYTGLKKAGFKPFYVSSGSRHHNTYYFNSQTDNSLINTMFQQPKKEI